MKGALVLRADASPGLGAGHVMRCLALALAARAKGLIVSIIGRVAVPWVREKLARTGIDFYVVSGDIPLIEKPKNLLAQLSGSRGDGWVVLDGYHFGYDCHKAVRESGRKLLVIDDGAHLPEYFCDILLNQNIGAGELIYKGDIGQKMMGPGFALLRPEFSTARALAEERRFTGQAQNILLTFGGGDFSAYLARIAATFNMPEMAGRTLRVIAGAMPPERVSSLLKDCLAKVDIFRQTSDILELFMDTDICVTAGGSTCWELCCLKVPFLTVAVAGNQQAIVCGLQKKGIAPVFDLKIFETLLQDGEARRQMAEAGFVLVDGLGADRVIRGMVGCAA